MHKPRKRQIIKASRFDQSKAISTIPNTHKYPVDWQYEWATTPNEFYYRSLLFKLEVDRLKELCKELAKIFEKRLTTANPIV